VFLASPQDVSDERVMAKQVLEQLQKEPLLEGRLALQVVAWDSHGIGVPLFAGLTPQDAIVEGLPKPSECDVVIVILWSRIGTRLDSASQVARELPAESGTLWEYRDAMEASRKSGRPKVLVYHRTGACTADFSDPLHEEKRKQWDAVQRFIAEFRNADGSFNGGYNPYASTSEFARKLDGHLRTIIRDLLGLGYLGRGRLRRPSAVSPFPGLNAFTSAEESNFFGRGVETDGLVRRCADPESRFVAVVGASGVGKSSLVAAGLIPRLLAGAIEGSSDWLFVRFTPGEFDDPFQSFAAGIAATIRPGTGFRVRHLAKELTSNPSAVGNAVTSILLRAEKPASSEVFVFVDQFEELFSVCGRDYHEPFVRFLRTAVETGRMRILVTLRADFYARCTEFTDLSELLRTGSYPLAPPGVGAMLEMITRPAERADLVFEANLPERIMSDMGSDRGALPLLAFALRQLWEQRGSSGELTHDAYESFRGVRGVIGRTAEEVFDTLDPEAQQSLPTVFRELVGLISVDGQLTATRRRASLDAARSSPAAVRLVERFLEHRLLVTDQRSDGSAVISVAHEALFSNWPILAEWIAGRQQQLWHVQMVRGAAAEWERHGRSDEFLWPEKRLQAVHAIVADLKPRLTGIEERFLGLCDDAILVSELSEMRTGHRRRAYIGDRIASVADTRPGVGLLPDGMPGLEWCQVTAGTARLGPDRWVAVEAFEITKYPVTWCQFRAFIEHPRGYTNPVWWVGLTSVPQPGVQRWDVQNCPAENVSWYDAVAFCRWLGAMLHAHVRLPTEAEWQRAAVGDETDYVYPWGAEWNPQCANTEESGLARPTAVGIYPLGASPFGVHDLSGNVWEWCSDEYEDPERRVGTDGPRVLKGGAWSFPAEGASAFKRDRDLPDFRDYHDHGFRVCCAVARNGSPGDPG
jgi:hypothetical protein